ncbi:MAG: gluconate 2-dehydrogenase subunit 3 family protein [Sulfurimonas sp.]|uniref:gluconate 2-dehydrogenase subunit 3 family protein n=1 Tax=Sulfurimonas sp. TaxID=2022749 RepID=UPI0025EE8138|nr:gluconate 2-dehydrogenase subunit 3 family protein [Sulfurimonas sp.]MCK9454946.1 gluconate 2-dehydrogenase subunit 3 family protein [Sulfurimonas sp.]
MRRNFFKQSFLGGAVLLFYGSSLFGAVEPLKTLALVQEDLFPKAKELEVDTASYLLLILEHSRVSSAKKEFLRNGVQWLHEESLKLYGKLYYNLSQQKRQDVLQEISEYSWGEFWIESLLTYSMEALYSDAVYGVNKKDAAQKWLGFHSGEPHPKRAYL